MIARAKTEAVYLTPPEAARRVGVNASKVIGWIRGGKLQAIDTSGGGQRPRYRIHEADLEAFLMTLRVNAAPASPRRRRAPPAEVIEFIK